MRAAILAGGQGTRLRPYTTILPKPLLPIGDRPILELVLRQLAACGVREVDLLVGHLGELIRAYFAESRALPGDVELRYHWEDEPLGTAGALRLLDPPDGDLLVMNGDILTELDYGALLRAHADSGAALTIATHHKEVTLALGVIEADPGDGAVTGFVEKPTLRYEVSMGVYVYSRRALDRVPAGRFDFPDLVLALLEAGEPVGRFPFSGPWYDIGTPQEYERAVAAYDADPDRFEPAGR